MERQKRPAPEGGGSSSPGDPVAPADEAPAIEIAAPLSPPGGAPGEPALGGGLGEPPMEIALIDGPAGSPAEARWSSQDRRRRS
ncbi:MAG TPA: hypothetical protein VJS45_15035, partial [Acidimicrobiia bacterium]|nr:hypothetical protein [Acidimicrobiia bacterium]